MRTVCLLASLFLLALSAPKAETMAAERLLLPDGSLDLGAGFCGKLNLAGWRVTLDADRGPMFSPLPPGGWTALGNGVDQVVWAVAVSGTDVYVGGSFSDAGGLSGADMIAKWNGSAWSALGTGANGPGDNVYSIVVSGSDVYAGGEITNMGGNPSADNIARWNGSAWLALGSGLNNVVYAVEVGGGSVWAGGQFDGLGGINKIARWNGSAWVGLAGGLNSAVFALEYLGTNLYVGGAFNDAGGVSNADKIASWNGSAWSALGTGVAVGSMVRTLTTDGTSIYAGGGFEDMGGNAAADFVARWDGSAWQAVGVFPWWIDVLFYGNGTLYAGGGFDDAGGDPNADNIARFNGTTWGSLNNTPLNSAPKAMANIGADLYVGGVFTNAGGVPEADRVAYFTDVALPVELVFFRAFFDETSQSSRLSWRTGSEAGILFFEIEHSRDGISWEKTGQVAATGRAGEGSAYGFEQAGIGPGRHFYRLKTVGADGGSELSGVAEVMVGGAAFSFEISPNPANGDVQIGLAGPVGGSVEVRVVGSDGRVFFQKTWEAGDGAPLVVPTAGLPGGAYAVEATTGGAVARRLFLKI